MGKNQCFLHAATDRRQRSKINNFIPIKISLRWQPGRVDAQFLNDLCHVSCLHFIWSLWIFESRVQILIMFQLFLGLRHREQSNGIFEGQKFCKVKISHLDQSRSLCPVQQYSVVLAFARKFALFTSHCSQLQKNSVFYCFTERINKRYPLKLCLRLDRPERLGHPFRCLLSTG